MPAMAMSGVRAHTNPVAAGAHIMRMRRCTGAALPQHGWYRCTGPWILNFMTFGRKVLAFKP